MDGNTIKNPQNHQKEHHKSKENILPIKNILRTFFPQLFSENKTGLRSVWRVGKSILLVQSLQHHIQDLQHRIQAPPHHRDYPPFHNQDEVGSLGVSLISVNSVLQKASDLLVALQENTPKLDLSMRTFVNNASSSMTRTCTGCKKQEKKYHQFHISQCSAMPSWHLTFLRSEQNQICFFPVLILQEEEPLLWSFHDVQTTPLDVLE